MSKKGQSLAELLAPLSAKYFISGEINTKVASMDVVKEKLDGLDREVRGRDASRTRRRVGRVRRLALQRARRRTPSRCCA